MSDDIARGVVSIEARDEGALASLRRVEREFDRTMNNIDRQEAEVRIKANKGEFDREVAEAEKRLDALKKKRANPEIGLDLKKLDREIAQIEKDVAFINKMKAEIHVDVEGGKEAAAELKALSKLEQDRAAAEQKYSSQRMRNMQQEARRRSGLRRQEAQELKQAEAAAYRENDVRTMGAARERAEVLKLQREYARLTDKIEGLGKRHAFTREARAKLELDTASAYAQMEVTKAALNRIGGHPPVDIKVDLDRRGIKRVTGGIADIGRRVAQGLANLPNMTLRLGPFTSSIKGAVVALGFLGPSLVDLAGAATSLIGVLGTGLAGAATIAGGTLMGLALNLGGVRFALTPMIKDFKIATQTTDAYHKAVLEYGRGSDEAAKAQDKMTNALKNMDPRARQAAQAVGSLGARWQKLTQDQANTSFTHVVSQYARTIRELQPTLAGNTNRTMQILDERFTAILTHLRSNNAKDIFDSLGRSANNFLNPFLDGLQHIGSYLGKVAESAARLFAGPAGNSFKEWARDLDHATQRGDKLDGSIRRLGAHAKSVGSFFLALGRLIVTVLNGSADSGKSLIDDMTNKLNEWNDALSDTTGQQNMRDFFDRSAEGAKTLFHTFGPLIGEFVRWSSMLAPFATGFLKGINFVGKLIGKLTDLIHLGGPLSTFAATLGALWAVGRIGSFIAMVAKAATAIKELGAAQTLIGLSTRSFGARAAAAGVPLKAVAEDAGAAAIAGRGARAARGAGPAIEGAGAAAGGAAPNVSRFGSALSRALPFLIRFAGPAGIAAGAALAFGGSAKTAADRLHDLNEATKNINVNVRGAGQASVAGFNAMADGTLSLKAANQQVAKAQAEVNRLTAAGKTNTPAYTNALQNLNSMLDQRTAAERQVATARRAVLKADAAQQNTLPKLQAAQRAWNDAQGKAAPEMRKYIDLSDEANQAELRRIKAQTGRGSAQLTGKDLVTYGDRLKPIPGYEDEWAKSLSELKTAFNNLHSAEGNHKAAAQQFALATINAKRAIAGFKPMTIEAASAIQSLNRQIGSIKTAKISMKFPDPRQARQVMQGVNSAINSGVPKSKAVNVALNSANAEQALRRLNALKLNAKVLHIRAQEGDALAAIARVRGVKLNPKVLQLLHEGDPNVIAAVRRILGIRLPPKTLIMLGNAMDAIGKSRIVAGIRFATQFARFAGINDTGSALGAALSAGLSWAGRVFMATFGAHHAKAGGGPVVGFAGGTQDGRAAESSPALRAKQDRAYHEAMRAQPTTRSTGKFNRPTLLVGEERKAEYVIATNPAYRRANIGYLRAAASDLGVQIVEPDARVGTAGRNAGVATRANGVVMAARGKMRHVKAPKMGDRGRHGQRASHHIGPIDTSDLDAAYRRASAAVDTADRMIADRKSRIKSTTGARTAKGKKKQKAQRRRLQQEINYINRRMLPRLRRERSRRKSYLDHANAAHQGFENLDTRIDTADTRMANADAAGNLKDFAKWRAVLIGKNGKGGLLNQRLKELRAALGDARRGGKSKWVVQLQNEIARTTGDVGAAIRTKPQKQQEAAQTAKQTAEDKQRSYEEDATRYGIARRGNWKALVNLARKEFSGATRQVAEAQLTPDNPNTPEDEALGARSAAANRLTAFWQGVYNRTKKLGNDQAITDAANELFSARNAGLDLLGGSGGIGQGAILSDARASLLSSFGSNTAGTPTPVWAQPAPATMGAFSPSGGFGPGGSGSDAVGTKNITVNNTFPTPPSDPHTWSTGLAWEMQAAF